MRIIGHGIDAVKIAEIKDEVDSTNKRWTEQFCSADERAARRHDSGPLPLLRELLRRQGSGGQRRSGPASRATSPGGASRSCGGRAGRRTSG